MELITGFFIFLLGLSSGSFLNVCIYRLPQGLSVVTPSSFCPRCRNLIAWYDNLPILSFFLLGGKCRKCGGSISFRYLIVEFITAILWLGLYFCFGMTGPFVGGAILLSLLLAVSATDIETGFIPDQITIPGMILGFVVSAFYPNLFNESLWYDGLLQSFIGFLVGGALLLVTARLGEWIFRKEAMGGGDIKLLAMCGAFLGWQKVVLVFFAAPFFALPFALYLRFAKKEETICYGPFLALAAAVVFFLGDMILKHLQLG